MKDEETQNSFVASTQKDCQLLSATGSVHWEWFYGWLQAFGGYFPKYADQGEGKGTFKNIFLAIYRPNGEPSLEISGFVHVCFCSTYNLSLGSL